MGTQTGDQCVVCREWLVEMEAADHLRLGRIGQNGLPQKIGEVRREQCSRYFSGPDDLGLGQVK